MDKQFCEYYKNEEKARQACQCSCEEPQEHEQTYYHCSYGNCCGYHCSVCGKFEIVKG